MVSHVTTNSNETTQIRFKKSLLAMCVIALSSPVVAFAADINSDEQVDEIVIKGTRAAIQNAQEIKRNADTFVDAISASDISALPDKSVLESLQRIPGISINRYSAATDPDHFSIEGSGVTLRGLPSTRSEFNGRDSFSASGYDGLNFADVPPELMAKVEVFKNQTADMSEGGISGTINLVTRKPFDSAERIIAFTAKEDYSDLRGEAKPSFSGLYSDRWDTEVGEFGLLITAANSKLSTKTEGLGIGKLNSNAGTGFGQSNVVIEGQPAQRWVPTNAGVRQTDQDRERNGASLVAQWRSSDQTVTSTFEYVRSDSQKDWLEHTFTEDETPASSIDNATYNDKYITSGVYRGIGGYVNSTRYQQHHSVVEDYSLKTEYKPSDAFSLTVDLQHIESAADETDLSMFGGVAADAAFSIGDSSHPSVRVLAPGAAVDDNQVSRSYFLNPVNYFHRAAMDHLEDSVAEENAIKIDAKYELDAGWAKSVEAGVRFADRDQTTKWSTYNWGVLSEGWYGDGGRLRFNGAYDTTPWDGVNGGDPYAKAAPDYEVLEWSNFLRNRTNSGIAGGYTLAPSEAHVKDLASLAKAASVFKDEGYGYKHDGFKGYKPSEINPIQQTNTAVYTKLNFGNEDDTLTGNVGVRLVKFEMSAAGGANAPAVINSPVLLALLPAGTAKFNNGSYNVLPAVETTTNKVLPSLNLKYAITDDIVGRFGVSKAVSYPDLGNIRNYSAIGALIKSTPADPNAIPTAATITYTGSRGNPNLKPQESTNFDAAVEWYFAKDGALSAGVFRKDMTNFFSNGVVNDNVTIDGVTNSVAFQSPINIGNAVVNGLEIGYNQFFDMLPAPFDGLGLQATLTLLDQSGDIPNGGLDPTTPPNATGGNIVKSSFKNVKLQGLSDTTYNIVGMYEKDAISARLAWNWRSEYMVTTRDVISTLPIYNEATGQLDASFFYSINDHFKVGVEGSNLLDELTKTRMQADEDGTKVPRNYFINDRRFSFVIKGQF